MSKTASIVNKALNKAVFSSLVLLFLCLVSCLGCMFIYPLIPFPPSALEVAASRLGFDPSLAGLTKHINTSIEPGMTREEVEQILGEIGEVEAERGEMKDTFRGPEACDHLLLKIPGERPIPLRSCYDVEGSLVSMQAEPYPRTSEALSIQVPAR